MKCCICNDIIPVEINGWDKGNNAEPVVENGRCCNSCNWGVVVPARIKRIVEREKGEAK